MSAVTEILSADQLHELWGAGFTIVRRPVDPFEIDPKLIPRGMSYQWNPIDITRPPGQERRDGWIVVPYSRHEGVFAPWGTPGVIQIGGLELCEKPKVEVEHSLERTRTKAHQLVEDWATKVAADGITGSVRVGTQTVQGKLDTLNQIDIGAPGGLEPIKDVVEISKTRTIETTVGLPADMTPHIAAIFAERDRLEGEVVRKNRTLKPGPIADKFYAAVEADKGAPWWPTLRAILLPIAIENVRAALKKNPFKDARDLLLPGCAILSKKHDRAIELSVNQDGDLIVEIDGVPHLLFSRDEVLGNLHREGMASRIESMLSNMRKEATDD